MVSPAGFQSQSLPLTRLAQTHSIESAAAESPSDQNVTATTKFVVQDSPLSKGEAAQKAQEIFNKQLMVVKTDKSHEVLKSGEVIVIAGTSTAGKSSIVAALKKIDPDIVEEDLDLRGDAHRRLGPNDQRDMMDDVIDHALKGRRVIVHLDQAYKFLDHICDRQIELRIKTVLAYCPFHELSKRLIERNRKAEEPGGNTQNLRNPLMPIDAFSMLYTQAKDPAKGFEQIERSHAEKIYNEHFDKMVMYNKKRNKKLPPDDVLARDKVEFCQEFLQRLGFKEGVNTVVVEPRLREQYNFIFDTHKYADAKGSAEIAQMIYDSIKIDSQLKF